MTPPALASVEIAPAARRGGIGLYEWHPASGLLLWDDVLAGIFADRSGETPMQTWCRRVHLDDQPRVLDTFSAAARPESEAVYRLVMDDGRIRHVLSRATYVEHGPDGAATKVVGVMLDVTESQEEGARLVDMLESISDGFLAFDRDLRMTYVNRTAETVLGMPRADLLGRVVWEVFPDALGTKFESMYRRVLAERVGESFDEYYPEPLNMWVQVNAQPSEEGMVIYFQDITARRAEQHERELLLAAEQLACQEAQDARLDAERARATGEQVRQQLAYQATHDGLTGLLNRSEFERQVQLRLAAGHGPVVALFMDLDRFKLVNDSLGHAAGDALLVHVARRLPRLLGPHDVVARLGGDEFVVLLTGRDPAGAEQVAARLLEAARLPVLVGNSSITTTASVGLATASPGATVQTLLRDADVALYRAKDAGRDRLAWFDADAHGQLLDRIALEADLGSALTSNQVGLHYQPAFDVTSLRLIGVEGLARWRHPRRGMVRPDVFIPIAEDTGLIRPLGRHIIGLAIQQAVLWADLPGFIVWVNVSGRQLETPGLADQVLGDLAAAGLAPERFGVEVTESVLMDERAASRELTRLAAAGVSIAIDDFGTGYSSLARLSRLPISVLKIDRSFVNDVETAHGRAAIDVIVQLARIFELATLAEGIETPRQLELLREAGCDYASGYLLGRPAPASERPLVSAV
ncbi:MAG: hypothetical protein JWL64_2451 [Frankiales bacterium]|nr:hypothetical protein [Frankiales bacterium]